MSEKTIEKIYKGEKIIAIIIRSEHEIDGLEFFTEDSDALQVGIHNREKSAIVEPHVHVKQPHEIEDMYEVFYIIEGKVEISIYDQANGTLLKKIILETGDSFIHMGEGHGLKFLEKTKMFEVKQGPYLGRVQSKLFIKNIINGWFAHTFLNLIRPFFYSIGPLYHFSPNFTPCFFLQNTLCIT